MILERNRRRTSKGNVYIDPEVVLIYRSSLQSAARVATKEPTKYSDNMRNQTRFVSSAPKVFSGNESNARVVSAPYITGPTLPCS